MLSTIVRSGQRHTALALGAVLVLSSLAVAGPALAGGPTGHDIRITPATVSSSAGGSLTVQIVANSTGPISGATASITFDPTRVQITDYAQGTAWSSAGASAVGFPSAANKASAIAAANAAGKFPAAGGAPGFAFIDGESSLPAGDTTIYSVTFQAGTCGSSAELALPVGPTDGSMLSGEAASYGDDLAITTTGATVSNPCPTPTPTPTATPVPTPTPTLAPANGMVNVTGTLGAGFLALECPTSLTIPLVRNTTNIRDFTCTVFADINWSLNANDPKTTNKGYMTDGAKVLSNPMRVAHGAADVSLVTGGTVATGTNSVVQDLQLRQFVAGVDAPGSYAMQITFEAVSGF